MTNRTVGDWVAAVTMAAVLIVPCVAAAGQGFALDEQVRQSDQSARDRERERERAEQARERAERERERGQQSRDRFENFYEQGQNAIERAQWQQAIERFTVLVDSKAPRADACLLYTSPSPRDS